MPNCTVQNGGLINNKLETALTCWISDIENGKHLSFSLKVLINNHHIDIDPNDLFRYYERFD